MTEITIPPQLQSKLTELTTSKHRLPLFIEAGESCFDVAAFRTQQLMQRIKANSKISKQLIAERPRVLVLLSHEHLSEANNGDNSIFCTSFACLNEDQSPREDLSALASNTGVLVTTTIRAIDHIRRDNIVLGNTKYLIAVFAFKQQPGESEEEFDLRQKVFGDDLEYIITKLDRKAEVECFVDDLSHLHRDPQEVIPKSLVIARPDWERSEHLHVSIKTECVDTETVMDILYAYPSQQHVVICNDKQFRDNLKVSLEQGVPHLSPLFLDFKESHDLRTVMPITDEATVVACCLSLEEINLMMSEFRYWTQIKTRIITIISPETENSIIYTKETLLMNDEMKSPPDAHEVLAGKIDVITSKLLADPHPEQLDELKKIIKKHVPFMRRGYFTAYLLRELLNSGRPEIGQTKTNERIRKQKSAHDKVSDNVSQKKQEMKHDVGGQSKKQRQPIVVPEGAKTLYINIGKMKRLYAKDLSQLLQSQLGISRDDIYSIRVHDKYSFVTLPEQFAEQAIAKLNGMEIKGRVASVTYSNKE